MRLVQLKQPQHLTSPCRNLRSSRLHGELAIEGNSKQREVFTMRVPVVNDVETLFVAVKNDLICAAPLVQQHPASRALRKDIFVRAVGVKLLEAVQIIGKHLFGVTMLGDGLPCVFVKNVPQRWAENSTSH